MKKIVLFLLLAVAGQEAGACDICGGVSHLNPYMFPHLSKSYVSFAYLRNLYYSTEDGTYSKISNNALLVSGQVTLNSRLQVMAFVPYNFNQTEAGISASTTKGLGDVTLLANYNLLRLNTATVRHSLSLGAGIKLPTGNYNNKLADVSNEALQLGTGSLDYLANAVYRVSAGNVTVSALGTYRYTTANSNDYRYGDVLTTGASAVYVIDRNKFSLNPYVQVTNEMHYRDASNHVLQNGSGGSVLYTGGGVDFTTAKLTFGVNAQAAARQNLLNGNLTTKPKFSARISFTL
jgi:hypothetical protein